MKRILTILILLLTVTFLSWGQDIKPITPLFKNLQSPSFSFHTGTLRVWIYKGSIYGWTELASQTETKQRIDSIAALYRIEEAPADHKVYGRRDSTWVEVSGGMLGNQTEIFNEIPSGLVNGSNIQFYTDTIPISNSERIFLNGIRQLKYNDYTISLNNISFVVAPETYDLITVDYLKSAPLIGTNYYNETPSGLVNGSNKTFNTLFDIYDNSSMLYLNGVRQIYSTDYTAIGNVITFITAPETNDILIIDYKNIAP